MQPPDKIRRSENIVPPFAIGFRLQRSESDGTNDSVDLGRYFALATLENDENDEVVPAGLAGELTVSLQTVPNHSPDNPYPSEYFLFRRLKIQVLGRFRIRVVLIRMDPGDERATVLSEARSGVVQVQDGRVESRGPCKRLRDTTA